MDTSERPPSGRRSMVRGVFALIAGGAVSPLLSGCAAAGLYRGPEGRDAPAISTGDEWLYDELNGYNRERVALMRYVTEQTSPLILRLEVEGKPLSGLRTDQREEYDAPWVVSRDAVYDWQNHYVPALPLIPALLEPGVRESWQSMVTHDEKERARRWHVQLDVIGRERVEVPAGAFDALRIRRLIKFEHPDFFRSNSERVETLWYAPEVKRWVKREWRGEYLQKMRKRTPALREDWIVWELRRFSAG